MKRKYTIGICLACVIVLNLAYLIWVIPRLNGAAGYIFYLSEWGLFTSTILFAFCHYQLYSKEASQHLMHHHMPTVDVFIPCYDEPISMIRRTVCVATEMTYHRKTIYILDDGHRQEVKKIAEEHGVHYLARKENKDAKAGNLNNALNYSHGEYLLILDADQVPEKNIIEHILPHFTRHDIAFVTTKQRFDVCKEDFNRDCFFYEHVQLGKSYDGCPISTGSGVIYRRSAIKSIGGFSTWNLVEDLTTSYSLHQNGYKSVYLEHPYTTGLAPQDLKNIYKQRGTWAVDTLRLFFHKNPFLVKGLNFRQRVHYFELCYSYIASAVFLPTLFIFLPFALFFNYIVVNSGWEYVIIRAPGLIGIIWFYEYLSKGAESNQFWAGFWPVYLKAIFLALRKQKISYKVTDKVEVPGRRIELVLPQLTLLVIGLIGIPFNIIAYGPSSVTAITSIWVALELWWMFPIIMRGFAKEHRHKPMLHPEIHGAFT